jgi:hypothetical protein
VGRRPTPEEHAKEKAKAERELAIALRLPCIVELLKHHQLASSDQRLLAKDAARLRNVLLALGTYDVRGLNLKLRRPRGRPPNAGGKIMIYLGELASIYEEYSSAAGKARRATVSKYPTSRGTAIRRGRFVSFAWDCFLLSGHDEVTESGLAKAWERRARKR